MKINAMIKKIAFLIKILILIQLLVGCESAIFRVYVTKHPYRLSYIVGYDTELDLRGGELTLGLSGGKKVTYPMKLFKRIINNDYVDFNTPGVYTIVVYNHNGRQSDSFEVTVINSR